MSYTNIAEMAIEDATIPNKADMLAEDSALNSPKECIYRTKVSPVLGTHVGPRVLNIAVFRDK